MSNNQFNEFFNAINSSFKNPSFDVNKLADSQRKNAEAFSSAGKIFAEGIQAVASRQTELVKSNIESSIAASKDIFSSKTPETNTTKQAELVSNAYEQSINNSKELSEMLTKSTTEAFDIINKRATETFSEASKAA